MMSAVYVDVLPTDTQFAENKSVMIVIVDGEDGLIMNQVESLFALSQFDVRRVLADCRVSHRKLTGTSLRPLQEEGLVSHKAKQVTFIPRESLRVLLEFIGTAEGRQFFRKIWPEHHKPRPEPKMPRQSFRTSVVRTIRKLVEERHQIRQELDEMRRIVEDIMRSDMQSMTMLMTQSKGKTPALTENPE